MLSGQLFSDDPFFAGHMRQMQQMDQMFRDPFMGMGGMMGLPAAQQGHQGHRHRGQGHRGQGQGAVQQRHPGGQLAPMGMFDFGFNNMFQNMRRMMDDMHGAFEAGGLPNNPNGQTFSQQSFVSYSSAGGGGGTPRYYQASSSTTQGPGGVRETRKTLRDSDTGVERMAVGHHIGQRGHVIQRQRNRRTGEEEENQEYINLEEEEARQFDREWQERTRQPQQRMQQAQQSGRGLEYRRRGERSDRRQQAALPAPEPGPAYPTQQQQQQQHRHSYGHSHNHTRQQRNSYRDRE